MRHRRMAAGLIAALLAIALMPIGASGTNDQVCEGLDSGKIDTPDPDPATVTVTAPDGKLIDRYCVKAGSAHSGDGPVYVDVDPPQKTVVIDHPTKDSVSHYSVSYVKDDKPVDACDARNKPGGVSLTDWLAEHGNPDCIDIEVTQECGTATGVITRNDTIWDTWDVAFEEGAATYDLGNAQFGSISFPEDYNGGSVDVDYYLVGPESDYGVISGEPNFWQENAATITVDTDCQSTPTTEPPTTTTTAPTTTTTAPTTTTEPPTTTAPPETTVPPGDPFVSIECNEDGVNVYVTPGAWTLHGVDADGDTAFLAEVDAFEGNLDGTGLASFTIPREDAVTMTADNGDRTWTFDLNDCDEPTTTTTSGDDDEPKSTPTTAPELPHTGMSSSAIAGFAAAMMAAGTWLASRKSREDPTA